MELTLTVKGDNLEEIKENLETVYHEVTLSVNEKLNESNLPISIGSSDDSYFGVIK